MRVHRTSNGDLRSAKWLGRRPATAREALSLVRFYSTPPIAKDELMARIRADATVSEPVRERALRFARQWPEGK